tara:strand:- start:3597 stop:4148 length:552 start_codon:yes stop_codon:yes gene_type:complete
MRKTGHIINYRKANKLLKTIRELEYGLMRKGRAKPVDYFLNRCLNNIEKIKALPTDEDGGGDKDWFLEQAWLVYLKFQEVRALEGETQDYAYREVAVSNLSEEDNKTYDNLMEPSTANVRSGGLGFARVDWKTMGVATGKKYDRLRGWFRTVWPRGYNFSRNLEDTDYWVFKNDPNEKKTKRR